jgi:transposase-like protein
VKNKDKLLLISLLNNAGAAIEAAYDILTQDQQETAPECEHPQDKRKDYSTMGTKRWQCTLCGYLYEQRKEEVEE